MGKRSLQISVRTFLVALSVFMIWLGFQANSARRQRIAVAALVQAGVEVMYDFQFDANGGHIPAAKPPYPKAFIRALGIDFFAKVVTLKCYEGNLDEVVIHCAKLKDVKDCLLGGSKLSDDGLRHVAKMSKLERLGLEHTQVSDEGLESLLNLANLKLVSLVGTTAKVSEEMIEELEDALPGCEFFRDRRRYSVLADVVKQLETVRSGKARITKTVDGVEAETMEVIFKSGGLQRTEFSSGNIDVINLHRGEHTRLMPTEKKVVVEAAYAIPKGEAPISRLKKIASQAMGRVPVRTIEGVENALGFSIHWPSRRIETIWVEVKSRLPTRYETLANGVDGKSVTATLREYEYNIDIDDRLFEIRPPENYELEDRRPAETE